VRKAAVAIPAATALAGGALGLALRQSPASGGSVHEIRPAERRARALPATSVVRRLPGPPVSVASTRDGRQWALLETRDGGRIALLDRARHRARLLPVRLPTPVELIDQGDRAAALAFAGRTEVGTVSGAGLQVALLRTASAVEGLAFDDRGQLWYTARDDGLVRLDPVHGTARPSRIGARTRRRLGDLALVAGGDLWLRDDGGRIGRVAGRKVSWTRIPDVAGAGAIAGDPIDGVWTSWPNAVVHTSANRDSAVFRLPDVFGRPGALVTGPDGNVWCAAHRGARLARFAPGGGVAFFRPGIPRRAMVTDLSRRPGLLVIATRRPPGLFQVPLRDLRSKLGG
jgi:streptogramin lyase